LPEIDQIELQRELAEEDELDARDLMVSGRIRNETLGLVLMNTCNHGKSLRISIV